MKRRLPAEWEEQDGVLLAWPHEGTDWRPHLDRVEPVFAEIASKISEVERVLIAVPEASEVKSRLRASGARMDRVSIYEVPTNDTWSRDFGPITVEEEGHPVLLDFGFNGWGLKFPADQDNQVARRLAGQGAFGSTPLRTVGLVLEGGSIESDGRETVLTTAGCLLGPNRNPHLDKTGIEAALQLELGARRVLWLENGNLTGDDTDSHVDTLARFGPGGTILHVACDDPGDEHFEPLALMAEEFLEMRSSTGQPYRTVPLPWPSPKFDADGRRLPATYANFAVLNGLVLVPSYRDDKDDEALRVVARVFPGRTVVAVDCLPLLLQHGSLHCVTMQLPKGVLG